MRVGILFFNPKKSSQFLSLVKGLAKGVEKQGHDVRLIDAQIDQGVSLTSFEYLLVGLASPGMMAKSTPDGLKAFLRSAGHLSGKRSYAFIDNKGLRKGRLLSHLMKVMESEALYIKRSDVLRNADEAEAVGEKLHIEKNVRV